MCNVPERIPISLLLSTDGWDTKMDVAVETVDMRTATLAGQLSGRDINTETLHRDH